MRSHSLCAFSRQLRPFCRTAFPASRRNLLPAVARRSGPAASPGSFSRPLRLARPASRSVFRPGQCPALPAFRTSSIPDRSATPARFRRLLPAVRFSSARASAKKRQCQKVGTRRPAQGHGRKRPGAPQRTGGLETGGSGPRKRGERRKGPGSPPTVPNATGKPFLYGRRHSAGTGTGFHLPSMASRGKATSLPA